MKAAAFLPILLIMSLIVAVPITHAQAKPKLYVEPVENIFETDTTPKSGTNFTVTIKAADWVAPGVYGYQFNFVFDSTMLKAVAAEIPTGHWFTPADPTKLFIVDGGTKTNGSVSFAVSLLNPEVAKTGGGVVATVTLQIIKDPDPGKTLTSELDLGGVIMVNPSTGQGYPSDTFDIVPATYQYKSTAPAPALPKIYVDPLNSFFTNSSDDVGTNFTISIKAANWTEPGVFGYDIKLLYNSTLIEAVSTNIPEDHWLKPANASNIIFLDEGTINQTAGHVTFNATLLNDEQGKTGDGTIATINFTILLAPPPDLSCTLDISNTALIDPTNTTIPQDQYDRDNGNYKFSAAPTVTPDLNDDGKVNILDIALWGEAFGATPSNPRWNPRADQNLDSRINMIDAVLIAIQWTG